MSIFAQRREKLLKESRQKSALRRQAEQLSNLGSKPGPTIDDCIVEVALKHGIPQAKLLRKSRTKDISHKRHEVFWLARKLGFSYPQIAARFEMDHTSVLYGVNRVQSIIDGRTT